MNSGQQQLFERAAEGARRPAEEVAGQPMRSVSFAAFQTVALAARACRSLSFALDPIYAAAAVERLEGGS